ncbi:hypothetical protein SIID45300_00924 [Candidatus Magnetaquicoccaceae bacterium FCR-1]|uniref:Uncharacterized protein n=1 Tax=Candidatus Magnetaquiglobus chichijimensis TaxID=3141448 RepID=A0ABQ0C6V3_9PROT
MEIMNGDTYIVPSSGWSGVRGKWPLVAREGTDASVETELPMGLTPEFLLDLFQFHMAWLSRVSGLKENEAKRRVVSLLKSGRIGYQDDSGNKRILPEDAILWMIRHA